MPGTFKRMEHIDMAMLMFEGHVLEGDDGSTLFHDKDGFQVIYYPESSKNNRIMAMVNLHWNMPVRVKTRVFDIQNGEKVLVRNKDTEEWKLEVKRRMQTPDVWTEYPFWCDIASWKQIARYAGNEKYHRTKDKIPGSWTKEDL